MEKRAFRNESNISNILAQFSKILPMNFFNSFVKFHQQNICCKIAGQTEKFLIYKLSLQCSEKFIFASRR